MTLGNFRSFAFVHDPRDEIWTRERQSAFATTLAEAGCACKTFSPCTTAAETAAFLRTLPLPAAVMAASDLVAATILRACEAANLAIPDDIAILGVDNDIALCNRLVTRLSSIEPDFEEEEFRAVIALENLFGNIIKIDEKPLADVRLVERESTKPLPPATRLVDRALAFINDNYRTPITPRDIATHLGVSRRLIDLRFRQLQHETLLATITKRRLEDLCKMLREESGSLRDLIAACGFGSAVRAAHLFKLTYGLSMSDYRTKCHQNPW